MWLFIYLEKKDFSKGININILIHKEALANFQPVFQQIESDRHEVLQKRKIEVDQAFPLQIVSSSKFKKR